MRPLLLAFAAASFVDLTSSAAFAQYGEQTNTGAVLLYIIFVVVLVVGGVWLLLLPTFIAFRRKHPHRWLILIINVLFSATGIGWIVALIWALNSLPFTDDFHGRLGTVRIATDEPLLVSPIPRAAELNSDPADQLQRLKALHTGGTLTDEEYRSARAPLVERMLNGSKANSRQ